MKHALRMLLLVCLPLACAADDACKLAASVIVANSARTVFKTTTDHYWDGRLAVPAHSLVYTGDPDANGVRRIKKVWIGKNWTPGLLSFRASDQPAGGVVTPTSDRYTFTARFTRMPNCYIAGK